MRRVLITGGAGFIGSNVALGLIDKGYEVTVLDSLSPQIHGDNPELTSPLYMSIKGKVRFVKGTVTSRADWMAALDNQDAVIHLAAETGTGQSMYEIEKYVGTNIGGTALLLDILANCKHQVKRVVVAESRAIYGEGKYRCENCGIVYPKDREDHDMEKGDFECRCPQCGRKVKLVSTTEDSKLHPSSVYGITKQVQGQLVRLVCSSIGVDSVSFRYQNVYGPGQSLSNPYTGILSIFSTQILNHHPVNIFEDGKESRDFVYINDVVDATIKGLEITVAKTLCKKYGIEVPINVSGNYRIGDIRHNYADISLAKKVLGFEPKWSFKQGIQKFSEWVLSQPPQIDNFESSIDEMKSKGLYKNGG